MFWRSQLRIPQKDIECGVRPAGESPVSVPVLAAAAHKLNVSVVAAKGELTLPHLSCPVDRDLRTVDGD
ncbi:hypothetical protein QCM80_43135 [Bradyrhizobium sp. SSUT112]|uniref:hypothetical protein n=1 Tax=Bradyrhizobium sp. SSUT112 TaxID=3040604 RepID=UPI0024468C43|nr:hypothetical protein [Bradyrhizobium sp. SSUT112]MDH2357308.1 hypothetical protein [Bradyrhizobium sp. SSUT112]